VLGGSFKGRCPGDAAAPVQGAAPFWAAAAIDNLTALDALALQDGPPRGVAAVDSAAAIGKQPRNVGLDWFSGRHGLKFVPAVRFGQMWSVR
jgi:hypothetical protein